MRVNAVHLFELLHVVQIDLRVHNVLHSQSAGFHNGPYVFEHLSHLLRERIRHRPVGPAGALARDVQILSNANARRIRTHRRRAGFRNNGLRGSAESHQREQHRKHEREKQGKFHTEALYHRTGTEQATGEPISDLAAVGLVCSNRRMDLGAVEPGPARISRSFCLILLAAGFGFAQEPCTVERPTATFQVPHVAGDPPLSADPSSPVWRTAGVTSISKDCSKQIDYPDLSTQVRSFWTATHLYLLFSCPYKELNLFLPPQGGGPRNKLWDRDVVEMFLGDDWTNIRHYREFEIAPTGDWIDLAIDLDHESYDQSWRSGWTSTCSPPARAARNGKPSACPPTFSPNRPRTWLASYEITAIPQRG